MANKFSILTLMLWLLFLSVKPTTSQQSIENLCAKAIDTTFCLQVLVTSPSQSLDDLLKTAVSEAGKNASATGAKIKDLLTNPNNPPDLIVAYFQCSNYYSAAVAALDAASQILNSRPAADVVNDVASAGSTVDKDGDSCEASFKNGAASTLSSDNRGLKLHSNVISLVCAAI